MRRSSTIGSFFDSMGAFAWVVILLLIWSAYYGLPIIFAMLKGDKTKISGVARTAIRQMEDGTYQVQYEDTEA